PGARDVDREADRTPHSVLAGPHVEGPRGVMPLVDGLRIELKKGETAKVALANGQSSEVHGPCAVEFWSSSNEVGGWRLTPIEPATSSIAIPDPDDTARTPNPASPTPAVEAPAPSKRTRNASPPPPEAPPREAAPPTTTAEPPANPPVENASPKVQAAWVRAADAQRRDDFTGADTAYNELCQADDAATRDAARLARAQLWIAHG